MSPVIVTHWRVIKVLTGQDFYPSEIREVDNIWYIRHPETALNRDERVRGWVDIELTGKGLDQKDAIVQEFKDIKAPAIFTSDLVRASIVADALGTTYNIPVFKTDQLRPADLGDLHGARIVDVIPEMDAFMDSDELGSFPNGESYKYFKARLLRVLHIIEGTR